MAKQNTVTKKKPSVEAGADDLQVKALTKALSAAVKPILDGLSAQTTAINSLTRGFEASIAASAVQRADDAIEAAEDDENNEEEEEETEAAGDGDGDADDEEAAAGDEEDDVEAADESADEEVDAGADDEGELDEEPSRFAMDDQTPGKLNKHAAEKNKKKGSKTTVTTQNESHKNVAASVARLTRTVEKLAASSKQKDRKIKMLETQIEQKDLAIEAAGERGQRRSVSISAALQNTLAKGSVDFGSLQASGEKVSVPEFDRLLASGNLTIQQRVALKNEAARAGIMDEGLVTRSY